MRPVLAETGKPVLTKVLLHMEFTYNDGGRKAAGKSGSANDCVCRSIAIVTGRPYMEIWEAIAEGNFNQRSSGGKGKKWSADHGVMTTQKWFQDYMRSLGFTWVATMGIGTGCKVHVKSAELPAGRIIIKLSRHYAAVIGGVLNDNHDCARSGTRCVYGYWKLEVN